MPIEFNCPSCAKLLRTPDESAGKRAKCPQCGTIVDVPGTRTTPPPSPLGPEGGFSQPDPLFPQGAAFPPIPPTKPSPFDVGGTNPYATPTTAGMPYRMGTDMSEEAGRKGLPWERLQKSAKTFWETSKLIMGSPNEAFSLMFRTGGLGTPIGFLVIGGLIGGIFSGIYGTLMQLAMLSFVTAAGAQNGGDMEMAAPMVQVAIQLPMAIVGGTAGALIGSFISAAIYHVFLMMLGGAKYGFETTYRVVAYVNGAVALLQAIPLCGQYTWGLVALVYLIIGLSSAHRIGGGKAAAAVLLPFVVCCGIAVAIGAAVVGLVAANQ